MAGRDHDYPEQFAAGLKPHAVQEKYYYARRPEVTRVVDVSGVVDQISRGQPGQPGEGARRPSRLAAPRRAGEDAARAAAAGRRRRDGRPQLHQGVRAGTRTASWAKKYGVPYAEAFHYIGPGDLRTNRRLHPRARGADEVRTRPGTTSDPSWGTPPTCLAGFWPRRGAGEAGTDGSGDLSHVRVRPGDASRPGPRQLLLPVAHAKTTLTRP